MKFRKQINYWRQSAYCDSAVWGLVPVQVASETEVQNNAHSLHGDTKPTRRKPTVEYAVGLVMPMKMLAVSGHRAKLAG